MAHQQKRKAWQEHVVGASLEESFLMPQEECVLLPPDGKKPRSAWQEAVEELSDAKVTAEGRKKVHPDPPGWAWEVRKTYDRHHLSDTRVQQLERLLGPYRRPSPNEWLKQHDQLELYLHDLDYQPTLRDKYSSAELRLCCHTEQGSKVAVRVRGFLPYLYVRPNRALLQRLQSHPEEAVAEFRAWLQRRICAQLPMGETPPLNSVCEVQRLERFPLYGFQRERITVLQVKLASPKLIVPARQALWALRTRKGQQRQSDEEMPADDEPPPPTAMEVADGDDGLEKGLEADQLRLDPFEVYEADVLFTLRFIIDKELRGCGWFRVPRAKVRVVPPGERQTRCQLELMFHVDDLTSLPLKQSVPRELRLVAFEYGLYLTRRH